MNNQTIGRDVTLDLITSKGVLPITSAMISQFDTSPVTSNQNSKGIDGVSRYAVFPEGWKGSLTVERMTGALDQYWAAIEADYYAGASQLPGTVTETIQEPDGSVSVYRYTGVVFDLKDVGTKQANQFVKQKLDFMASRRLKVA